MTGKVAPSEPEVHMWALLVLLGPGQLQLGAGAGRGGLPRVREWVGLVLQQREQHKQPILKRRLADRTHHHAMKPEFNHMALQHSGEAGQPASSS